MSNRIELGELETFLYASADILRGYVEASDYKSYVFPLLFFKRVCDVYDEETEGVLFSDLPEDYSCPLCAVGKDEFEAE